MRRRRSAVIALSVFAAVTIWLLSDSLLGGKVFSANDVAMFAAPFASHRPAEVTRPSNDHLGDAVYLFHPSLEEARRDFRKGRLPLWNPGIAAGHPLLASQQPGLLYPINWLAYILPFAQSLVFIAAAKLLVAATGTFLFSRALGLTTAPAVLAAVSFAFGTGFVVWLEHPHTNVYAVLPWLLLLTHGVLERRRLRDALLLALTLGVGQLAGHPESLFVAITGMVAYAGFSLGPARREPEARRAASLLGLAILLGAGLGAIMSLPFLELLSQASGESRSGNPDPFETLYAFTFPEMWGRPDKVAFGSGPAGNYAQRALYVGALPLLLAVGGLVIRRERVQMFFLFLAALSLLAALDTPVLASGLRDLPLLDLMNVHYFVWLSVFSLAILGGFGLQALLVSDWRGRKRALGAMVLVAALPTLWAMRHTGLVSSFPQALRELPVVSHQQMSPDVVALAAILRWCLISLVTVVAAAVLAGRRPTVFAAVAIALTAVDLVTLNRGYHPAVPERTAFPPIPRSVALLQRQPPSTRFAGDGESLGPDLANRYGLNDMRGADLPVLERYVGLYSRLGGVTTNIALGRTNFNPSHPRSSHLLDVFSVRQVLDGGSSPPADPEWRVTFERPGERVYVNPSALPRAWVAHNWRRARSLDSAIAATATSSRRALEAEPVIEGLSPRTTASPRSSPAHIRRYDSNRVTIETESRGSGQLILTDTYYPGWRAEVDGREAEIRPANAAFRAVAIPAGRHTINFEYRPASFVAGAAVSITSLLFVALGLALPRLRRLTGARHRYDSNCATSG